MIPSKKEGICTVCGHKQPLTFQIGDSLTCSKCGHIVKPIMYPFNYLPLKRGDCDGTQNIGETRWS